jgi:hypothetical protein
MSGLPEPVPIPDGPAPQADDPDGHNPEPF